MSAPIQKKIHFRDVTLAVTPSPSSSAASNTVTTPASATLYNVSLEYTKETEWADVTDNSQYFKQYLPGFRGLSGSLSGWRDQNNFLPFADGDIVQATFTYKPYATGVVDTVTIPVFCIKTIKVSGDTGNAIKHDIEFVCSGSYTTTQTPATTAPTS